MSELRNIRIPGFIRWLFHTAVVAIIGMAISWGVARLPGEGLLSYLESVQKSAHDAVDAFDPLTLGRLYLCSWDAPSAVDCQPPILQSTADINRNLSLQERIRNVALAPPPSPRLIGLGHWANYTGWPLGPLAAALDLFWHLLIGTSIAGTLFVMAQFVLGFLLVFVVDAWIRPNQSAASQDHDSAFLFFGLPLGTILLGCGFGYLTKWIMIGGLDLFGGVTSLAGLCCTVSFVGVTGYEFVVKFAETALHEQATKNI